MAGETERRWTALWSAVASWASATVPSIHISVGLFALVGLGMAHSSPSDAIRQEEETR